MKIKAVSVGVSTGEVMYVVDDKRRLWRGTWQNTGNKEAPWKISWEQVELADEPQEEGEK